MINKMVAYKVKNDSLDEAKMLVREFVENIKLNEGDTLLYRALQESDDPTKFIHFMTFQMTMLKNSIAILTTVKNLLIQFCLCVKRNLSLRT